MGVWPLRYLILQYFWIFVKMVTPSLRARPNVPPRSCGASWSSASPAGTGPYFVEAVLRRATPFVKPKNMWPSWITVMPQRHGACTFSQWNHAPNDRTGVVDDGKYLL